MTARTCPIPVFQAHSSNPQPPPNNFQTEMNLEHFPGISACCDNLQMSTVLAQMNLCWMSNYDAESTISESTGLCAHRIYTQLI